MSPYDTPGVYRIPVRPARTGGLEVGVPAFLGYAARSDQPGRPQPLRQWSEFAAAFGDAIPDGYLAAAVRGFFENGGRLCYVAALDPAAEAGEALDAGLQALAPVDDVDLVAAPDIGRVRQPLAAAPSIDEMARLQRQVILDCERHGGRLALLDPPADADIDTALRHRQRLGDANAALYYPWLVVAGGGTRAVPPCGHVAGIYAATDHRVGVFKAPANAELQGVLDLVRAVSHEDQARLNPEGINALRVFPGRGIRVWGARTLRRDPNWRYVSVRRLFMTAARWIERNLTAMAFEPHDARLWARIGRELTVYFNGLFEAGALKGASSAEAFFIKCDAETNPPAVRDAGMVVTDIGLAPAIPNEMVLVRISVAPGGTTITALG
jgi:phage tail sheath protein FI